MENGYYYRADDEETIDVFCDDCIDEDRYTIWEVIRAADEEVCCMCGKAVTSYL